MTNLKAPDTAGQLRLAHARAIDEAPGAPPPGYRSAARGYSGVVPPSKYTAKGRRP
jgi:hypothetical protein